MKTLFFYIPNISWKTHGRSVFNFIKLFFHLNYFFITRRFFLKDKKFPVEFTYNDKKFKFILSKPIDLCIIKEVFVDKEYDVFLGDDPKIIIDLGAHIGDTAIFFSLNFPNTKIVAIEPFKDSYERLIENVACYNNIIALNLAIGAENKKVALNVSEKSSLSNSVVAVRDSIGKKVYVDQISIAKLFEILEIQKADAIKFDIEGSEFEIFKNSNPVQLADYFIGELHEDLAGCDKNHFLNHFREGFDCSIKSLNKKGRYTFYASIKRT